MDMQAKRTSPKRVSHKWSACIEKHPSNPPHKPFLIKGGGFQKPSWYQIFENPPPTHHLINDKLQQFLVGTTASMRNAKGSPIQGVDILPCNVQGSTHQCSQNTSGSNMVAVKKCCTWPKDIIYNLWHPLPNVTQLWYTGISYVILCYPVWYCTNPPFQPCGAVKNT